MPNKRIIGVVAVAVVVAIATACAGSARGRPPVPASPTVRLSQADVQVLASLLEVADARRADTAVIDRALASNTPFVRAIGVRTAGQIGVTVRAAVLRSLTTDADSAVAADAAFALGLLHDSTAGPALAAALGGPASVVAAAAWSLGELGERGRSSLEAVLRAGQPAASLPAVLQATAKLRPVPAALVVPYFAHARVEVRRAAVYAVTRSRVPAATTALVRLAERLNEFADEPGRGPTDAAVDLRSYLARGLTRPVAGDSLAPAALAALRRLVEDVHPHVRINAIRAVATYGTVARSDLARHLRDADGNARLAVAQSLGGVFDTKGATDWVDAWSADTGYTFRRALLATAARAGVRLAATDPSSPAAWQHQSDWRLRVAAAEAAGAGSIADVDSIALPLLRDPDARVRNAAFGAAVAWVDSTSASNKPYGRSALRIALDDSDAIVRATLLDALRPRARALDATVALNAWRRAARDVDNDARLAALRVIAAAWTADSASFGSLRDSLLAVTPPSDPIERAIGRTIGPLRNWPNTGVTPRPSSWYAEQVRTILERDRAGHPLGATINTARGAMRIVFLGSDAPLTVANFVGLARRGYYNGLSFHRVVPNFVAQDGDPRGDGSGGPGYAIRDELNRRWYDRGAVGMALSGPDTGGSQYFLAHSPQPHLDGHYTVFGRVVAGLDVLDALVQGDRIVSITIQ